MFYNLTVLYNLFLYNHYALSIYPLIYYLNTYVNSLVISDLFPVYTTEFSTNPSYTIYLYEIFKQWKISFQYENIFIFCIIDLSL